MHSSSSSFYALFAGVALQAKRSSLEDTISESLRHHLLSVPTNCHSHLFNHTNLARYAVKCSSCAVSRHVSGERAKLSRVLEQDVCGARTKGRVTGQQW